MSQPWTSLPDQRLRHQHYWPLARVLKCSAELIGRFTMGAFMTRLHCSICVTMSISFIGRETPLRGSLGPSQQFLSLHMLLLRTVNKCMLPCLVALAPCILAAQPHKTCTWTNKPAINQRFLASHNQLVQICIANIRVVWRCATIGRSDKPVMSTQLGRMGSRGGQPIIFTGG